MQEGHHHVLVDLQTSAQLYNNLYLGWTKHSDRAPEMASLLAIHSLCISLILIFRFILLLFNLMTSKLYRKILLHQKSPGLDGRITGITAPTSHLISSLLEIMSEVCDYY